MLYIRSTPTFSFNVHVNSVCFLSCLFNKRITIFYIYKVNISNWTRAIFKNFNRVELDVILCVIYKFYNTTLWELTSAIVTRLKISVFINKLNKRASVKDKLQVGIFIKTNFFVYIINIYQFYEKRMNSKINWIYVYKIKFTNERKMQNFEQKIIEIYFDYIIIDEIYIIRTSNNNFWNVLDRMKKKQNLILYAMLFNI